MDNFAYINTINELFTNKQLIQKIQEKLPKLFQLAELESSRAGKIGMEVGSVRGKIIIALLILSFGEKHVETQIPITRPEVDVILKRRTVSIKTISGRTISGVKLIWTVDAEKALDFQNNYKPVCDIILVHINWNNTGGFYYIPLKVQNLVLTKMGRKNYLNLPKAGTNPRGVEFSKQSIQKLMTHSNTKHIEINWKKENIDYLPYQRWIDLWNQD